MKKETFESRIKPILLWMGTIVASIMAAAYIVIVFVLIEGFKAETILNTTLFSIITALIGFCIMQMLKVQGQSFAANIEENKKIRDEYNKTKTKDKKARSMKYYWFTSGAQDIFVKCITLALTSIGMVYIMIKGNGDYNLLFLAAVNLMMFAGFGLISLVKTYDFYNDSYVPYMLEKIEEVKQIEQQKEREKAIQAENERMVAMAQKEHAEQGNANLCTDSGSNLLDTSMGVSVDSDNIGESLVVDSNDNSNTVLGGTVHTSDGTSTSSSIIVEENS